MGHIQFFRQTSYFYVLIICHMILAQSGQVTFWGGKNSLSSLKVYIGLPPDASATRQIELRCRACTLAKYEAVFWAPDYRQCRHAILLTIYMISQQTHVNTYDIIFDTMLFYDTFVILLCFNI